MRKKETKVHDQKFSDYSASSYIHSAGKHFRVIAYCLEETQSFSHASQEVPFLHSIYMRSNIINFTNCMLREKKSWHGNTNYNSMNKSICIFPFYIENILSQVRVSCILLFYTMLHIYINLLLYLILLIELFFSHRKREGMNFISF